MLVNESLSDQAHRLFSHLAADPSVEYFVPDLFFIECTNILWKYTQRFGRPIIDSLDDLADLRKLALRTISTKELMGDSLVLAVNTGLTAYDACYAVLAQRLDAPIITADHAIMEAVPWAVWLGVYDF